MDHPIKTTLRIGLLLATTLSSAARSDDFDQIKDTTPAQRAKAQTEYMKSHLSLTDAQLPKIAAINEKYAEQMEPVIKGTEGALRKMMKARTIQENKNAELRQILTPAQLDSLEASKDDIREAVKRARANN